MLSETDMLLLKWDESYSVKIKNFDEQHKHLFDLVGRLHDSILSGTDNETLRHFFSEIIRYTMTHFAAEEAAMEAFDYPGLHQHRLEHQELTEAVLDNIRNFRKHKEDFLVGLMGFLQTWLTKHILESDRSYSQFFRDRGLE
jgi:hemerythrin